MKRHKFAGGAASHGSMFQITGSIGSSAFPSRVFKGMRMACLLYTSQVGLTTVAPCRPATGSMPECEDQERGRSVSLPRPAYPPESSGGSAGTFQRGSCKAILQDMDQSSTARHYRQAKHNSQNPFTIAIGIACRQPIPQDLPYFLRHGEGMARTATNFSGGALRNSRYK